MRENLPRLYDESVVQFTGSFFGVESKDCGISFLRADVFTDIPDHDSRLSEKPLPRIRLFL